MTLHMQSIPNVPEKNDPTNKLLLNHGFGIKTSAAERYASDPVVIGIIKSLCEKYNIRYQRFVNRSDIPGGEYTWSYCSGKSAYQNARYRGCLFLQCILQGRLWELMISYILKGYWKNFCRFTK